MFMLVPFSGSHVPQKICVSAEVGCPYQKELLSQMDEYSIV